MDISVADLDPAVFGIVGVIRFWIVLCRVAARSDFQLVIRIRVFERVISVCHFLQGRIRIYRVGSGSEGSDPDLKGRIWI